MARDYKNARRPSRKRKRRQGLSPRALVVLGFFCGGIVAVGLFVLLGTRPRHGRASPSRALAVPRHAAAAPRHHRARRAAQPAKAGQPQFDFYKLLPSFKVVIPEREHEAEPGPAQGGKVVKPGRYYLQAGAFRRYSDADELKAKLALLGIEASIQKVTIDSQGEGQDVWHRVRVGPFTNLSRLNTTRATLQAHGINALVIRLQHGGGA